MSDLSRTAHIMEVGLRDGLQIEPVILSTQEKLALLDALLQAGIKEIEIGSFVSPRLVPQMADTITFAQRIPVMPGITYRALWLNQRGLATALATPPVTVDGLLSIAASEAFSVRNTGKSIAESLADMPGWIGTYAQAGIKADTLSVMAAFGCNTQGEIIADALCTLIAAAMAISTEHGADIRQFTLSDTMGWANPKSTHTTIATLRMRWPDVQIKLHLHDTRGLAIANAATALALGVSAFESSIGGLGGCPFAGNGLRAAGNLCTEDLVFLCQTLGVDTGLDLTALIGAAALAERLVDRPLPGKLMKSGWTANPTLKREH